MWKLWHKHQIPQEFRDYDSVSGRTAPPAFFFYTYTLTDTHPQSAVWLISTVTYGLHFSGQFLVLVLSLSVPGLGNCLGPGVLSALVLLLLHRSFKPGLLLNFACFVTMV